MTCGRRWGKSLCAVAEAIREGVRKARAVIWWIAPTYSMAMIGWRKMMDLLPMELIANKSVSERRIELVNGSTIWVKSAQDPDSLRGEGLDLAILDEAAFIKEDAWNAAVRPALADKQGKAVFISTPLGRNWFWRVFLNGRDSSDEWRSWSFRTVDNPYIAESEVNAAQRSLPEAIFRQEFLAEFLEDAGSVFRNVVTCATAEPRHKAGRSVMGVDWGKHEDWTVISVMDAGKGEMIGFHRYNRIDYTFQVDRLKAWAERYKPVAILAESNAMGEPLIDQLRRDGLPVRGFATTHSSKAEVINGLALAFDQQEIRILPQPELINELQAFEMTQLPAGGWRYAAPEGMHDDCVISLALAWHAAKGGRRAGIMFTD